MKKYKAVLFDLDGTINDSGPGIMNSCRYAMEKMGHEPLPEETMRRFVGPSLQYSFQTFCGMDEEEADGRSGSGWMNRKWMDEPEMSRKTRTD